MRFKSFVSLILCVFLVILCTASLAENSANEEQTTPDFKQFYWGDSKEKVLQLEGEPDTDGTVNGTNATYIAYKTQAVGLDMLLAYYFCDDGLYNIRYILLEEHSNEALYIDDYNTFKKALIKKYGKPLIDSENWENDSKKEYYADKKGDALSYGYLTYSTFHITDNTYITMEMSADNYEISMIVDYVSKTIFPGEADYSNEI